MASVTEAMIGRRREGESALALLDAAADAAGIRRMDADFDGQHDAEEPMGRLLFEAFAPKGTDDIPRYLELMYAIDDGDIEEGPELDAAQKEFHALHEAVYGGFRKRYALC